MTCPYPSSEEELAAMRLWHLFAVIAVIFAVDAVTDPRGRWLAAIAPISFTVTAAASRKATRR